MSKQYGFAVTVALIMLAVLWAVVLIPPAVRSVKGRRPQSLPLSDRSDRSSGIFGGTGMGAGGGSCGNGGSGC